MIHLSFYLSIHIVKIFLDFLLTRPVNDGPLEQKEGGISASSPAALLLLYSEGGKQVLLTGYSGSRLATLAIR